MYTYSNVDKLASEFALNVAKLLHTVFFWKANNALKLISTSQAITYASFYFIHSIIGVIEYQKHQLYIEINQNSFIPCTE